MPPSRPRLVTTPSRAASRVRASPARLGRVIVTDGVALRQPGPERRDRDDAVALVHPHRDDAAGLGVLAVDRRDVGPDDLAAGADQEELLVLLRDLLDGRDVAGLLALEADQADALRTAVHRPELRERDPLAVARLGQHQQVRLGLDHAHRDDEVAGPREADADDAGRVAAHRPDVRLVEAGDLALRRGDDHVVVAGGDVDPGELVLVVDRDRPDAGRADPLELLERRLLDLAATRREDEVAAGLEVLEDDRRHRDFAGLDLDAGQVDDRRSLGLAAGVDDRVDLRAEDATAVREEQRPVVGVRDDQVLDCVLLAGDVADDALAAAVLAAVRRDGLALDVAAAADRDDDVLVGDEVLVGHLPAGVVGDAGLALAGV